MTKETAAAKNGMTLVDALQAVDTYVQDKGLYEGTYKECSNVDEKQLKKAIGVICSKLKVNEYQAQVLARISYYQQFSFFNIVSLSDHLDTSILKVLEHQSDYDELVEKGLLGAGMSKEYFYYWMPRSTYEKILSNGKSTRQVTPHCANREELYYQFSQLVGALYFNKITIAEYEEKILAVLKNSKDLPEADFLLKQQPLLSSLEFRAFVLLVIRWIVTDDCSDPISLGRVCLDEKEFEIIRSSISTGVSPLIKLNLVQHCSSVLDNICRTTYQPSESVQQAINPELASSKKSEKNEFFTTVRHQSIAEKQLYYNNDENEQVANLYTLFSQERMPEVMAKLHEHGMQKGLTCLFYGAPGTGKTETAYQMARTTGRDLLVVNLAQLRSKWVGESEKNVKKVFDDYRKACRSAEVLPILFLNEADAVIGHRMKGAERSCDKSENSIQDIILQEMEDFEGILIATSNLAQEMDRAFERRFFYKVMFKAPNKSVRTQIWKSKDLGLTEAECKKLAGDFASFSGGQISNVARKAFINELIDGAKPSFGIIHDFCRQEAIAQSESEGNGHEIGFLSQALQQDLKK